MTKSTTRMLLAMLLAAIWAASLPAQEEASKDDAKPATEAAKKVNIPRKQDVLAGKYERLETILFNKATLEALENPRRASLLRKALQQSQNRLTLQQLKAAVGQLGRGEYTTALKSQRQSLRDLQDLLKLLESEDRSRRNKSRQQEIEDQIKEVERLLRIQRSIQGRTQGGDDADRLAKDQEKVANRTQSLIDRVQANNQSANGQSSDGEPKDGEPKDGEPKDGEPKDGDPKDGAPKDGDPKDGEPKDGDPKDGDPKDGDPKDGEPKDGDKKPGDQAPGDDKKPGDQKPGDAKSGDMNPMPGEQQGNQQQGNQQQGNQQQGNQQQGNQQQGNQQQQQPQQQEDSAQKRLEAAEQKMRDAQKKLEQAKRDESIADQEKAKEELAKAKAELEEILRQLREEEVGRMLALLESRFRKMLDMQLKVHDQTQKLAKIPQESRSREFDIQCGRLSFDERKIETEAEKALLLLKEEGSSIAFPETVEMMREDMGFVASRLGNTQVGEITQGRQEEIIAALEEMLEALKLAQEEQDQRKQQQQQQQQQQGGQQQDPSLVSTLAEFKMIRSLQVRVNNRTQRYANLLKDAEDLIGQAEDDGLLRSLQQLSNRQERLHEIMRDIALKRNR